jgi:hypothetical protein
MQKPCFQTTPKREYLVYQGSDNVFLLSSAFGQRQSDQNLSGIYSSTRYLKFLIIHKYLILSIIFLETIRGWTKPKGGVAKWLPFVKTMTLGIVGDSLPNHHADQYRHLDTTSRLSDAFISSAERQVQALGLKQSVLLLGDDNQLSVQKMTKLQKQSSDTVYLKQKTKRVTLGSESKLGRNVAHPDEEEYVMDYIRIR